MKQLISCVEILCLKRRKRREEMRNDGMTGGGGKTPLSGEELIFETKLLCGSFSFVFFPFRTAVFPLRQEDRSYIFFFFFPSEFFVLFFPGDFPQSFCASSLGANCDEDFFAPSKKKIFFLRSARIGP